jgi:protein disulfide-isomerase A6
MFLIVIFFFLLLLFLCIILIRFGVQGYPTLKFFPAGSGEPEDYQGGREVEDFVEFINSKVGTQRNVDGSLKSTAGRIPVLDQMLSAVNYVIDSQISENVNSAVSQLTSASEQASGKVYASIIKNVLSKGTDYIINETARIQKLLSNSANMKPENKKNFQLRSNILKAFAPSTEPSASTTSASEEEL